MKHLQTFEGFGNFFKRNKPYLIKYKVTNVNALPSYYSKDGKVPEKILKEWDSDVYEYIQKSKSEEDAKDTFLNLWNEKSRGHLPSPRLNIISIEEVDTEDFTKWGRYRSTTNEIEIF